MLKALAIGGQQLVGAAHQYGNAWNLLAFDGPEIGEVARVPVDETYRFEGLERQIPER